jgi:hypothetical protein
MRPFDIERVLADDGREVVERGADVFGDVDPPAFLGHLIACDAAEADDLSGGSREVVANPSRPRGILAC